MPQPKKSSISTLPPPCPFAISLETTTETETAARATEDKEFASYRSNVTCKEDKDERDSVTIPTRLLGNEHANLNCMQEHEELSRAARSSAIDLIDNARWNFFWLRLGE